MKVTSLLRFSLGLLLAGTGGLLRAESAPVTVTEDAATYTLDNGIVTAQVAKDSGDLVSLRYKNLEMLATFLTPDGQPDLQKDTPGQNLVGLNKGMTDHQYGFWSHDAMGVRGAGVAVARVTIDPKTNGGARGEVAVKGSSQGRKMGTGPGVTGEGQKTGQFAADVEIRWSLGRGETGVYTYCQFEHPADYPTTSLGEARFCAKLADFFDWLSVAPDPHHFKYYPKELREGDKYVYTVNQTDNPAFGWSSSTKQVGFWCLNASMEYMSGGPTKVEFGGHRDTNAVAAPCVLNYWRSSHYGGAVVDVAAGEHWTKVIGPFMLYLNTGANPQAMYDDARAQQKTQAAAWPYGWVAGVDYPVADGRATVRGQLALTDPLAPGGAKMSNVRVGLTAAAWTSPMPPAPGGTARVVDWQQDAKNYQFWTHATDAGRFELPNVRPGTYTLHAFADGVLGEFARADVKITAGPVDLGKITWTPVRHGRQLWDIGIPNRNGAELFKGESYWEPEIPLDYAKLFPNDVNFTVGTSDYAKDWFFQQVPHNENPAAKAEPFYGIRTTGRATPFSVTFDLPAATKGRATLRLALCGTATRQLEITVNGQPAGTIELPFGDGAIARHGKQGLWYERELGFDAALLKAGTNVLKIIVPAGPINNGILYDYVRLELDDGTPVATAPAAATTDVPTIWIAGDSTADNGTPVATGWGKVFGDYFDPAAFKVVNRAIGGRSSRTYTTEGHWAKLAAELKAGDIVLIQFGMNDGAERNSPRLARGSLDGIGDEAEEIENQVTKKHETLHTFGWYVRQMIADTRAKGATPILLSLTVRDFWKDGKVERGAGHYGEWARQLAVNEKTAFIDATKLIADRYEQLGHDEVNALFPRDHVHTGIDGARLNAYLIASGLKGLREQSIIKGLTLPGRMVPTAAPGDVYVFPQPPPKGAPREEFAKWLNLPDRADPKLPTVWLIGDSTVRNGRGNGYDGQFGWGDPFEKYFYPGKTNIVNRAVGGTGARTFQAQWKTILPEIKKGDIVLMQFGHNDNGARGALKGTGEETEEHANPVTKEKETVHTFGWYLRSYIADIRAAGATPVVCSLVPRNRWKDGKVVRDADSHAGWAHAVAESEKAAFVDLNELIAAKYDQLGQEATTALFADKAVHTGWVGAELNAQTVVEGLRALKENPLAQHLRPDMAVVPTVAATPEPAKP